jgi:hypothetical protein
MQSNNVVLRRSNSSGVSPSSSITICREKIPSRTAFCAAFCLSTIPDDALQVSPLHAFAGLAQFQATRINWLHKKELAQGKPLPALAQAIRDYGNMLPRLQEMRFDCGQDKYKRVKLTSREQQVVEEARQAEDYKQVSNAVVVLEKIFEKRNMRQQ